MIQYLRNTKPKSKVGITKDLAKGSWIRVERPSPEEVEDVVRRLHLDGIIVTDALDPHEVPRIENTGQSVYFISRLPDTDDDFNDFTTPIMFILHPDHIITISRDAMARLWQPFIDKKYIVTTRKIQTFAMMMEAIVVEYSRKVATINRQMRSVSADITKLRPRDISIFVEYERKLNDYMDALIPTNDALAKLGGGGLMKLSHDEMALVEDISIEYQQLIARCKSLLRTITNVRDSFRAVMDTRLNETMRILTVITLAFTVPTMVAGLYGMNVSLPGESSSPQTFWLIVFFSLSTSAALAFYFLYKRR
jgi:magnesium transporter